ncbi:MAG: hypothetical protein U0234_21665 [Sandaracinus sp.]
MTEIRRAVLVLLALGLGACCFGGRSGTATTTDPGTPTTPAYDPATHGEGQLPTPPVLFAGVEAPYPDPLAARGTQGAIVRSGTATAQTVSGALTGVAQGTTCSYVEYRIVGSDYDCRWNVTCGGFVLYGLGTGGYQHCEDPTWPAGTLMFDPNTSRIDTDPSFIFNANGLSVSDDAAGRLGAFTVTMTVP